VVRRHLTSYLHHNIGSAPSDQGSVQAQWKHHKIPEISICRRRPIFRHQIWQKCSVSIRERISNFIKTDDKQMKQRCRWIWRNRLKHIIVTDEAQNNSILLVLVCFRCMIIQKDYKTLGEPCCSWGTCWLHKSTHLSNDQVIRMII
jgi:hypothetical protein